MYIILELSFIESGCLIDFGSITHDVWYKGHMKVYSYSSEDPTNLFIIYLVYFLKKR